MTIACERNYTLHIDPDVTPNPTMWYPFEDALPATVVDTVNGINMVQLSGTAGVRAFTAGKVGAQGYLLRPAALSTLATVTSPSSIHLITDSGFTLTGWLSIGAAFLGNDQWNIVYRIYNGVWINGVPSPAAAMDFGLSYSQFTGTLTVYMSQAGIPLVPDISIPFAPVAGTYDWFRTGYNLVTGRTFLSVNNGAEVVSGGVPYTLNIPHTTGTFQVGATRLSAGLTDIAVDEWNFTNDILNAATIADYWNGGAGRTWP